MKKKAKEDSNNNQTTEKKIYFTKEHENAILKYVSSNDIKEKSELYKNLIQPVFDEMVNKIVYTYKFNTLLNIEDLKDDCKAWLVTVLDKYDHSKGSKAFTYFSVITKNWFIHKVKKQKNTNTKEIPIEDIKQTTEEEYFAYELTYIDEREKSEFWTKLIEEINKWQNCNQKENEKKVYSAIKILLADRNDIEIFNKKAIYLYLRELTGLNTKQIVISLKKFKRLYTNFKYNWDNNII